MNTMKRTGEAAVETGVEVHLMNHGDMSVSGEGFDRGRAIFPEVVSAYISKLDRSDSVGIAKVAARRKCGRRTVP